MAETLVENILPGQLDAAGNEIACVYAKSSPNYAVYRTDFRVMIHYADDDRAARRQRAALVALSPLRGQISGLIDGWRKGDPQDEARAERYNRRVADAILLGLEGEGGEALALLKEIRDDIAAERRSLAQTDYLLVAGLVGIILIIASGLAVYPGLERLWADADVARLAWTGAAGGTIGAFFSIATALRSRTILVDLQRWDNRRDAILRILVGTIGGAILICLFLTELVTLFEIDRAKLAPAPGAGAAEARLMALVIGFIAGFSERAVPDLLAKASLATDARAGDTGDVAGAAANAVAPAAAPHVAPEVVGADESAAAADADQDIDACLCDAPPVPGEEITEDKDLPIAVGGVSEDEVAPAGAPEPDDPAALPLKEDAAA